MTSSSEIKPVGSTTPYRHSISVRYDPGQLADRTPRRADSDLQAEVTPRLDVLGTYARFVVREGEVMIQIVDRLSNEVVREIPPEEILKMAAELRAYQQALEAHKHRAGSGSLPGGQRP